MPFSDESFAERLQRILDEPIWEHDMEFLREIDTRGTALLRTNQLSPAVAALFAAFQQRFNDWYASQHNLQKFLNSLVVHAVKTNSDQPVVELISAIDRKVVQ